MVPKVPGNALAITPWPNSVATCGPVAFLRFWMIYNLYWFMNVWSHLQGNFLAELCCSVLHCYCSRYRWASLAIRTLSQQIISNILELFGIIIWNHQRQHRRALNFCISIWAAKNAETKEATISHLQPSTLGEAWRKLQPTSWINAAQICNSGKIIMFLVIAIASSASLPSSAAVSTYPRLFLM